MHRTSPLLFLFLLIFNHLTAEEEVDDTIPLSNLEQGVSPIVHGCVNVISGDFIAHAVDAVLTGPQPLVFERFTCSSFDRTRFFYWKNNHQISVYHTKNGFKYTTEGGRTATFEEAKEISFSPTQNKMGFTNCGNGSLSARTNLKNNQIHYKQGTIEVDTAEGSKQFLSRKKPHTYLVDKEVKKSGQQLSYKYFPDQKLKSITFSNASGEKIYSSFDFTFKKSGANCLDMHINGSDGSKITYDLAILGTDCQIMKVTSNCAPSIKYEYQNKEVKKKDFFEIPLLVKKISSGEDGKHYRQVKYCKTVVNKEPVYRVEAILEPVGQDETPHEVYRFSYNPEGRSTTVTDALGQTKRFRYTPEQRLSRVVTLMKGQPYSRELFGWDLRPKHLGNLLYTRREDGSGNILKAHCYQYDLHGNVLSETFYGNITGNSKPILWNENSPKENGCNSYATQYRYNAQHLVTWQQDGNGRITLYEYDAADRVIAKYLKVNQKIILREFLDYDKDGVLVCKIKDNGSTKNRQSLQDVTERHITRITATSKAPYGLPAAVETLYYDQNTKQEKLLKRIENSFNARGELFQQVHYDCNRKYAYTLYWEHDAHGNCTKETYDQSYSIERDYDAHDNLVEERGPQPGHKKVHTYDFSNRLIATREVDATGIDLTTKYTYDLMGRLTNIIDPFGQEERHTYDELGREIEVIYPSIATPKGSLLTPRETKEYDVLGNVTLHTRNQNEVTKTTYNVLGKPLTIQHPDGCLESFEYYLDGTLKQSVDKTGLKTCFSYDYAGRILEQVSYSSDNTLLKKESNTYNTFHLLTSTDAEGKVTSYSYDGAGRLIAIVKGDQRTEYAYDSLGRQNITREYHAPNAYCETVHVFDVLGQIIEECIQDSQNRNSCIRTQYHYDRAGNVTEEIQFTAEGLSTTTTGYNGLNLPISITDALDNVTIITYNYKAKNSLGQVVLQTTFVDPSGNKTITFTNPAGQTECITKEDRFGVITAKQEMFYNHLGGLIATKQFVLSQGKHLNTITTRWERDTQNRPVKMTEAAGTPEQRITQYRYNAFGQQEAIVKPDGNEVHSKYDALGRLQQYYALDSSFNYLYTYDPADRVTKVVDLISKTTTYREYDSNGSLKHELLANGLEMHYENDLLQRTTKVILPDQSTIQYAHDALYMRKVTRVNSKGEQYHHEYTNYDQSGLLIQSTTCSCLYDTKMRLKEIRHPKLNVTAAYDILDNMVQMRIDAPHTKLEAHFTYNSLQQLTSEKGSESHIYLADSINNYLECDGVKREISPLQLLLKEGDQTYRYDNNGNLKQQGQTQYLYDPLDRLIAVQSGDQRFEYSYDAFNRRLTKTHNGKTESYLYHGQNEIGAVRDGKIFQLRVLGEGNGAEIGSAILLELDQNSYIPLHNIVGHVIALLNLDGSLYETYQYSAFGSEKIFDSTGGQIVDSRNPWRFSSKRKDEETGFLNFGRRYYDPKTLRWIAPDPLGYDAGPNLYAYANCNPLHNIDLYGEYAVSYVYNNPSSQQQNSGNNYYRQQANNRTYNDTFERAEYPVYWETQNSRAPQSKNVFAHSERNVVNLSIGQQEGENSFGHTNGMNNTRQDHENNVHLIRGVYDGCKVGSTCYETNLITGGLLHLDNRMGVFTPEVKLLAERLTHEAATHKFHREIAFSNGGEILHHALPYVPAELRRKITVVTMGSSKVISAREHGLAYAVNYVGYGDHVPRLSDPWAISRARREEPGSIKFIKVKAHSFRDYLPGLIDSKKELKRRGFD